MPKSCFLYNTRDTIISSSFFVYNFKIHVGDYKKQWYVAVSRNAILGIMCFTSITNTILSYFNYHMSIELAMSI